MVLAQAYLSVGNAGKAQQIIEEVVRSGRDSTARTSAHGDGTFACGSITQPVESYDVRSPPGLEHIHAPKDPSSLWPPQRMPQCMPPRSVWSERCPSPQPTGTTHSGAQFGQQTTPLLVTSPPDMHRAESQTPQGIFSLRESQHVDLLAQKREYEGKVVQQAVPPRQEQPEIFPENFGLPQVTPFRRSESPQLSQGDVFHL